MDIPRDVGNIKAVINVKNKDDMCFKWSVPAALHPVQKKPERVSKYREHERELNFDGISFPVSLKDITKFETQNGVSVNVFGYDPEVWIYPLRITKMKADRHVDLLLVTSEDNYHYCLIKDFDKLMHRYNKYKGKKYFCKYCLHAFTREDLLQEHTSQCMALNGAQKTSLPEEGENILEFTNYHKGLKVPFVIYADFESITQPIDRAQMDETRSYTDGYQLHAPCGYAYKVVCTDERYTKDTVVYRGEDCVENFLKALKQGKWRIWNILNEQKPLCMTDENEIEFQTATHCHICGEALESDRVRDHCHVSGKYRGAAHNACNLKFRIPSFIPVVMHNLKGYDSHLIMQHLGKLDAEITCIPNNMEKYVSFTIADRYQSKQSDEPPAKRAKVSRSLNLRFIDSLAFMNSSLDSLVKNLKSSGAENFIHLNREFDSPVQRELLTRKGSYPYDYMDSFERFEETQLPPQAAFYSQLKEQELSDEDYEHAMAIWSSFGLRSMGQYHDLYLKTDVLLLADVFENFRSTCLSNYELDPAHYFTAPGLSWDACLRQSNVTLELLTDMDMHMMFEKGIRGGISTITHRHAKANNKLILKTIGNRKGDCA